MFIQYHNQNRKHESFPNPHFSVCNLFHGSRQTGLNFKVEGITRRALSSVPKWLDVFLAGRYWLGDAFASE
jgi:hypothetical protein